MALGLPTSGDVLDAEQNQLHVVEALAAEEQSPVPGSA